MCCTATITHVYRMGLWINQGMYNLMYTLCLFFCVFFFLARLAAICDGIAVNICMSRWHYYIWVMKTFKYIYLTFQLFLYIVKLESDLLPNGNEMEKELAVHFCWLSDLSQVRECRRHSGNRNLISGAFLALFRPDQYGVRID